MSLKTLYLMMCSWYCFFHQRAGGKGRYKLGMRRVPIGVPVCVLMCVCVCHPEGGLFWWGHPLWTLLPRAEPLTLHYERDETRPVSLW